MKFGVGQSVPRTEDPRFSTGRGTYIDDINLPHMAHATLVYAQVPNAIISSIDTTEAEDTPGVIAVLTGTDAKQDRIGGIPPNFLPPNDGIIRGLSNQTANHRSRYSAVLRRTDCPRHR